MRVEEGTEPGVGCCRGAASAGRGVGREESPPWENLRDHGRQSWST